MPEAPVLYAEDEEVDVLLVQLAFAKVNVGRPLQVVVDGQQAVDYLSAVPPFSNREHYPLPCLVLLDLNLPRKSGLEVLEWMRQQPHLEQLPVVIYSSSSHGSDRERAQKLGIQDYLVKQASPGQTEKQMQSLKERWIR